MQGGANLVVDEIVDRLGAQGPAGIGGQQDGVGDALGDAPQQRFDFRSIGGVQIALLRRRQGVEAAADAIEFVRRRHDIGSGRVEGADIEIEFPVGAGVENGLHGERHAGEAIGRQIGQA